MLRGLIDARLLTSFEIAGENGEEAKTHRQVEVVHESLLSAWPRLLRWQTQDADGAQLRDQLLSEIQALEGQLSALQDSGEAVDFSMQQTCREMIHSRQQLYLKLRR